LTWTKKLVSLQDQNIAEKTEVTHLKLDKNRIQDDLAQLQVQYASATNEKEILAAKNNEMEREYKRLTDNILKLEDVVHKQQQVVLVERNNALNARNERSDMETELNTVKNTLAALQRDKRAMEEDLALQTSRINRLLEKGVPIADILGEETITQGQVPNAQVLAVRPDVNLVMLSIGSAQNVKPGYRFTISRGDQYVAQVQVEKVYPDMCSARIDPKMSKMAVEVNDDAKSH